ncbi:hypothetical protein ACJX0J_033680, partial [Zea mays]
MFCFCGRTIRMVLQICFLVVLLISWTLFGVLDSQTSCSNGANMYSITFRTVTNMGPVREPLKSEDLIDNAECVSGQAFNCF